MIANLTESNRCDWVSIVTMLKFHLIIAFLIHRCPITRGSITDAEYSAMPPFYYTDDYDHCMKSEAAVYCSIVFQLKPIDSENVSETWRILQRVSANEKHYRHDRLRHHLCVPKVPCDANLTRLYHAGRRDEFRNAFAACYSQKFHDRGLKGAIVESRCLANGDRYPIDAYDTIVALIIFVDLAIVLLASAWDLMGNLKEEGYLACFSLTSNLRRLLDVTDAKRADVRTFKSFEGVRFCMMYCVVVCHTGVLKASVPVANVEYLEKDVHHPLTVAIMHSTFIVTVYFAMTGLALGALFFEMIEKRPDLDVVYLVKGVVNRMFRLLPSLLMVVLFASTWMVHLFDGPFWHNLVETEYRRCRNNGWTNLLFINNVHAKEEMCFLQTWYLAADIQMFVVVTVLLGFVWKYPKYGLRILIGSAIFTTTVTFILHYHQRAELIVPKQVPENFRYTFLDVRDFHAYYTSAISNFSVYPISLLFGYLYHKTRNVDVFNRKIRVFTWWIAIVSIPLALDVYGIMINQPGYRHGRFEAAAYRSMERNLFVISALLALYGFLKGQGSFIRTFLESSAMQVLGRLTYSAFLVHYVVIRIRLGTMRYPAYFAMIASFYESLGDFCASYLIGLVLFLFVEMPFVRVQKIVKRKIDELGSSKRRKMD